MARFVKGLILRFGMIMIAVVDGGPEMKKELPQVLRQYGVKTVETSPYNPKANGLNEYGHYVLRKVLEKLKRKGKHAWVDNLEYALFAERTATKGSHGFSPFYLMHGWEPAYPLEVEYPTWRLINWNEVRTLEERLEARIRILQMKGADVEKAKAKVTEYRKKASALRNKELQHKVRRWPLRVGDLVLKYNVPRANDMLVKYKMTEKWDGPFCIIKHHPGANYYSLQEPGAPRPLNKSIHGDQLRKFIEDKDGWWTCEKDLEPKEERMSAEPPQDLVPSASGAEPADHIERRVTRSMLLADPVTDSENETSDSDKDEEDLGALNPMPNPYRGPRMHFEVQLKGLPEGEKDTYELID
ncbi:uncharacterized protein FFFS_14429 [Fusarium fujikuroi]|nr:uncharacterized protein FFFS_14429 [Fusarium fujikuroi]